MHETQNKRSPKIPYREKWRSGRCKFFFFLHRVNERRRKMCWRRRRRQKDQQNCFWIKYTENNACTSKKVIKCSFNVYRFHSDDCLFICSFRPFTLSLSPSLTFWSSLICTLSQAVYVPSFTVYFLSKWLVRSLACVCFSLSFIFIYKKNHSSV